MVFRFDTISFFLGMAIATIVWWFIFILKLIGDRLAKKIQLDKVTKEHTSNSLVENVYLNFLYKKTQELHIASKLFSLDEIIIEPKLLAPPLIFEPNGPHIHLNVTEETIPYLLDFPELGASFGTPTLSLPEAVSKGMNIIITGNPGIGKSTALAYYASLLSKNRLNNEDSEDRIPFLIHAADLILPESGNIKSKSILQVLISAIQDKMGFLLASRIGQYVEYVFLQENCLLLIDGMDEIQYSEIPNYSNYLKSLLKAFPNTRIIISAGAEFLDGLLSSNFIPMTLVPWNKDEQLSFIKKWGTLWEKYISNQEWAAPYSIEFDNYLINSWLMQDNFGVTPMELTIKTWNAYTGSASSNRLEEITSSHMRRLIPAGIPEDAIISIAVNLVINKQYFYSESQIIKLLSAFNISTITPKPTSKITEMIYDVVKPYGLDKYLGNVFSVQDQNSSESAISKLIKSGILIQHRNNKLRFSNPVYLAYFSSKGLARNQQDSINAAVSTAWPGQYIVSKFLSTVCDLSPIMISLISINDRVLKKNQIFAGRLLRTSENNISADTRRLILTNLVNIISDETNPIGVKTEALITILESNSPETIEILRQFIHSTSNELRFLAAIGIGILRDQKSTNELIEIIDTSSEPVRRAVCLALAEIGTNQALETLATFLLNRDEKLRNYSAEALANNAEEGLEALQEGINNKDILVRRAIVFGLARVKESWATEILERVQLNDDQWAVRNLAIEVLKSRNNPNPRIPGPSKPVHETPWVIEFANKHGYVLSPILPNTELLLLALKDSNKELFQSALQLLKEAVNPDTLSRILELRQFHDENINESIFQFFKHSALKGVFLKEY